MKFVNAIPAPKKRGRKVSTVEADIIRQHPGKWAVLREGVSKSAANSAAERIRNGRALAFPIGEFEAQARRNPKGEGWNVYVRVTVHVGG